MIGRRRRRPVTPWIWEDLVPRYIAVLQRDWESRDLVRRMRRAGLPVAEICERMGLHRARIYQILKMRRDLSPVYRRCNRPGSEIADLADKMRDPQPGDAR
jgi:hypothetical protein